jgi:DNA polymerase V
LSLFAIADANNFYCSVERVFNPALVNQPVVVLSNNDGCIVSRSNEVKKLGIKMAEPLYKVRHLCKEHHIHIFSSNYSLYGDMSRRVMNSLAFFAPDMEIYSIDEAFLDFSCLTQYDLLAYSHQIKTKVQQWTGIPIAIGIAPTKTMAKLANHIAKKITEDGVFRLFSLSQEKQLMQQLDVSNIWGIGRQSQKKLQRAGIHTIWDFYCADKNLIQMLLGINGQAVLSELKGIPCHHLEIKESNKKNIMSSRSFSSSVQLFAPIAEALANYVVIASEKLRRQQQYAQAICVYLRTNPHSKFDRQYQQSITIPLIQPSNNSSELISLAKQALSKIYQAGYNYQKVGFILLDLYSIHYPVQEDLFSANQKAFDQKNNIKKSQKLMKTIDEINHSMGANSLFYAAQGIEKQWMMKRDYQSPHYTSDWKQLLVVS